MAPYIPKPFKKKTIRFGTFLAFIITVVCASACKKMFTPPFVKQTPTPVQGGTSGTVAETITLDSDYYATKYIHTVYWYDSVNRVSRYFKYEVDSGAHSVHIDTIHAIHFIYTDTVGQPSNRNLPAYSVENYRTSFYYLANAAHQYFYDSQGRLALDTLIDFYKGGTDRGVVISRRMHYDAQLITVDNLNLDTYTSQKGLYRDSITTDGSGSPQKSSTLNGRDFVTRNLDLYNNGGYFKYSYSYSAFINRFNQMNVSGVIAFVQTGFPGGSYYGSFMAKNYVSAVAAYIPGVAPTPVTTNFQFITNPQLNNRVEKIVITRRGANQHGGYVVLKYK